MDILKSAAHHAHRLALVTSTASYTYRELLRKSVGVARRLRENFTESEGVPGQRVGFWLTPSAEYIAATWGTWLVGAIAVPFCLSHTPREIQHVIEDASIPLVLTNERMPLDLPEIKLIPMNTIGEGNEEEMEEMSLLEQGALLIYTSGTTGRPKGALHTHRSLLAQMRSLTEAWAWTQDDVILHALPLHHIHGIVNSLYTAHFNGACVKLLPKFSPTAIWSSLTEGEVSLFMGVPTMYAHLLSVFDSMAPEQQDQLRQSTERLRLYVSGSSACPVSIMKRWQDVTGHCLLERYGMTEIGMALGNPLNGERRPGFVGVPLPGVTVKIVADSGELCVKGETVFREYWANPTATAAAFDSEGFFKTGDIVSVAGTPPLYKILGRQSVDIIKSGGYKLGALEIESAIMEHPDVNECSVVGIPDTTYGEIVTAIISTTLSTTPEDLMQFCATRLAKYKIPRRFIRVERIPRNSMGKVNKRELIEGVEKQTL